MIGTCEIYIDEPMLEGHWFFLRPLDKPAATSVNKGMAAIMDLEPVYGKYAIITLDDKVVFEGETGYEPTPEGISAQDWYTWFAQGAWIEMEDSRED